MIYHNNLLLDVLSGKPVPRPPVWVMRQAGRILPGYREIRASVPGFKHLVKRPDLIAEVTTEPLDVLGVDAAILFSDILVIPEAMGVDYEIIEKKGPLFENPIQSPGDIDKLISGADTLDKLSYVFDSIQTSKKKIDNRVPLIGFSGAPWTLFAYMIEGSGSKTFAKARRFLYEHPQASHRLLGLITETIITYLKEKVRLGCDVIQLFDSWAEILSIDQYRNFCIPYVDQIFNALGGTPRIFFPKGAWSAMPYFKALDFEAISLDWKTPVSFVRKYLGSDQIIQGNLDPALLYANPEEIKKSVKDKIEEVDRHHIFNLGHGVYPDTDASHVKTMIDSVKAFRY